MCTRKLVCSHLNNHIANLYQTTTKQLNIIMRQLLVGDLKLPLPLNKGEMMIQVDIFMYNYYAST